MRRLATAALLTATLVAPAAALAQTTTVMRYADDFAHGRSRTELVQVPIAPARPRAAGVPHKAAILLFNFSDDASQPMTRERAKEIVFTGAESANAFHQSLSYGAVSFEGVSDPTGDVFGWYTIAATRQPCDVDLWASQAQAKATAAGVDLDAYDHIMMVFPDAFSPGCEFGGLGEAPGRKTWFHASQLEWAAAHELGHNLGMHHANAYDCHDAAGKRVTFGGTCANVEYGDRFDVMGATAHRYANGIRKAQLGYADVTTITDEGVYHLAPLAEPAGMRTIRIKRDTVNGSDRFYYLEVRRPEARFDDYFCMDPAVEGVTLRIGQDLESHLLDTVPETAGFDDAPLAVGRTYVDATIGLSIRTLGVGPDGADVAISFGGDLPDAAAAAAPDPGVGGEGVVAEYYGDVDLTGEPLVTVDAATVDFVWKTAAPVPGVPADAFSARYHGYLVPASSGAHVFSTSSDDGVRLWVNGEPLVDDWRDHGSEGNVATIDLVAGEPAEVLMEYYDRGGDAEARLAYQPPGGACQVVPKERMFHEPTTPDDTGDDMTPDEDPLADGGGDLVGGCAAGGGGATPLLALALLGLVATLRRRRGPIGR